MSMKALKFPFSSAVGLFVCLTANGVNAQSESPSREALKSQLETCMVNAYEENKSHTFEQLLQTCDSEMTDFLNAYPQEQHENVMSQVRRLEAGYREANP